MSPDPHLMIEMPKYQCHKQVHALKIKEIKPADDGDAPTAFCFWLLVPEEDTKCAPIRVPNAWILKHDPKPGGYFVIYADGYQSYSPAKAFEDGYTLIHN